MIKEFEKGLNIENVYECYMKLECEENVYVNVT
jgi:hypothetical protein